MSEMIFCQSCAMPLVHDEDFGTNSDGSNNKDYCSFCYADGKFTSDQTMEQMIETCIPHVSNGSPYPDEETARKSMQEFFPKLKRWNIV